MFIVCDQVRYKSRIPVSAHLPGPPFPPESFDRVLLDAPCSSLGQRPNMASTWSLKEICSYPPLQRKLFHAVGFYFDSLLATSLSVCCIDSGWYWPVGGGIGLQWDDEFRFTCWRGNNPPLDGILDKLFLWFTFPGMYPHNWGWKKVSWMLFLTEREAALEYDSRRKSSVRGALVFLMKCEWFCGRTFCFNYGF